MTRPPSRSRAVGRGTPALLALFALVLNMLVPAGFMPGTSFAAPVVSCAGQGAMPVMAMSYGVHGKPAKHLHDSPEHPCAFAGLGAASIAPDVPPSWPSPSLAAASPVARGRPMVSVGHGLAAPPPPSHAPPPFRPT